MIAIKITTKSGKVYYMSENGLDVDLRNAMLFDNDKDADDNLDCAYLQGECGDLLEYDELLKDYQYSVEFVNYDDEQRKHNVSSSLYVNQRRVGEIIHYEQTKMVESWHYADNGTYKTAFFPETNLAGAYLFAIKGVKND